MNAENLLAHICFLKIGLCWIVRIPYIIIRCWPRVLIIYNKQVFRWAVCFRVRLLVHFPKVQMFKDLFDHARVFYECNDPHISGAFWTNKGINFIDPLYQSRPVTSEYFTRQFRFKNTRDLLVGLKPFSFSTGHITVIAIITHHLLSLVGEKIRYCFFEEVKI